ncbi:MAG: peptidoglycan bridge formation glycyltransferase FemA/FemB family protein [Bacilli bacterium]|nr:peptidoglycan bridge formation glycyltransferase FemA/FemB family protein [Bacilli bacterium]
MKFVTNIEPLEYDDFVRNHKQKSHLLQSYAWGLFSTTKGLIPHYVGIKDDDKIICAALLLQKKLPLGYSYFYVPRGYVIDFNDFKLLHEFTNKIKIYVKERKGIFIKIDPDIELHDIDDNSNPIQGGNNNYKVVDNLIKLGYRHKGYNKYFESTQPRYTFRIDLTKEMEQLENNMNKSLIQKIKKSYDYEVEIHKGTINNIGDFYNLMLITSGREDFVTYSKEYYENFFKILHEYDMCELFFGKVFPDKIIKNHQTKLNETKELLASETKKGKKRDYENIINKLTKELEEFEKYKNLYPEGVIISAHIIAMYGNKVWELYAGNHNIFKEANANNRIYYDEIKYAKDSGYKIFDQFGTIGDLSNDRLIGLHNYKKGLGGRYIEFIGEFDLVTNKILYFIFTKLIPIYRKIIKSIYKKKRRV